MYLMQTEDITQAKGLMTYIQKPKADIQFQFYFPSLNEALMK